MKNILPSIILGICILTSVFLLNVSRETTADKEMRAAYNELNKIATELSENPNNGEVQAVVSNFAGQIVDGFKMAFNNADEQNVYLSVIDKVSLTDVKTVPSGWKHKEKIIGVISNDSNRTISSIKINILSYDADGSLIDVNNQSLSSIKALRPQEKIGFEIDRSLGEHSDSPELLDTRRSSKNVATVISFKVAEESKQNKALETVDDSCL